MSRPTTEENQGSGTGRRISEAGSVGLGGRGDDGRGSVRATGSERAMPRVAARRTVAPSDRVGDRLRVGEEQRDLAFGGLGTVGSVNEVLAGLEREIAPDRARARPRGGWSTPMSSRTTFQVSGPPSTTIATSGLRVMNDTRSPKNGLLAVLLVVPAGEVGVDGAQLERDDREALALDAGRRSRRRGRARRRRACRGRGYGCSWAASS